MNFVFLLLVCSACRQLTIKPPKTNLQKVSMQIGEILQFNYPETNISHIDEIYSRSVVNTQSNDTTMSRICYQYPPEATFTMEQFLFTGYPRKHAEIVTDFTELLYKREVIDAALLNNQLFTLFQNGSLLVLTQTKENTLVSPKILNVVNKTISEGQVLVSDDKLIVIADSNTYVIDSKQLNIINLVGDSLSLKFSMAVILQKGYFAVAQREEGIAIYKVIDDKVLLKGIYNKQFFTQKDTMYVVDIEYNRHGVLYVLDGKKGLLMMDVANMLGSDSEPALIPNGFLKSNCDNLLYHKGEVIMVCGDIFKFGTQTDQKIQQLPKPLFKVKEMASAGDVVIMMGDNLFNFYWHGRYLQLFEFYGAQKILITTSTYIAVQDSSISIGKYSIDGPILQCQADDLVQEQSMEVIFKTSGKCNTQYLNYVGDSQIPQDGDTCTYISPVTIQFWKADNLELKPVAIGVIVMGGIFFIVLVWMFVLMIKQKRLRGVLQQYEGVSSGKGYNVMVEEGMGSTISESGKPNEASAAGSQFGDLGTSVSRDVKEGVSQDNKQIDDEVHEIGD